MDSAIPKIRTEECRIASASSPHVYPSSGLSLWVIWVKGHKGASIDYRCSGIGMKAWDGGATLSGRSGCTVTGVCLDIRSITDRARKWLAGVVRIRNSLLSHRLELVDIAFGSQMSALAAHIRDDANDMPRQLVLDVEMELLHVWPNLLLRKRYDPAFWECCIKA